MLSKLCKPALLYLVISTIAIIIVFIQNIGAKQFCVGTLSCNVPSITMAFLVKILYVLFWTWILNLICKSGHTRIAWFLLLLPFIAFFIMILLMMNFFSS
jgi:hypothetical protein